jgi:hypothetical protein
LHIVDVVFRTHHNLMWSPTPSVPSSSTKEWSDLGGWEDKQEHLTCVHPCLQLYAAIWATIGWYHPWILQSHQCSLWCGMISLRPCYNLYESRNDYRSAANDSVPIINHRVCGMHTLLKYASMSSAASPIIIWAMISSPSLLIGLQSSSLSLYHAYQQTVVAMAMAAKKAKPAAAVTKGSAGATTAKKFSSTKVKVKVAVKSSNTVGRRSPSMQTKSVTTITSTASAKPKSKSPTTSSSSTVATAVVTTAVVAAIAADEASLSLMTTIYNEMKRLHDDGLKVAVATKNKEKEEEIQSHDQDEKVLVACARLLVHSNLRSSFNSRCRSLPVSSCMSSSMCV